MSRNLNHEGTFADRDLSTALGMAKMGASDLIHGSRGKTLESGGNATCRSRHPALEIVTVILLEDQRVVV
ncbi:MAG: hypothetical protein ACR2OU_06110, partial [Thermomicrobiales bacterium]